MLRYNLLFLHVISAMGVFTALGMEALALTQARRASSAVVAPTTIAAFALGQRVGGPSMLLLLASGFWLATAYWRWQGAWMGLGFAGLIAVGAVGGLMTGRRVGRLQKKLGEDVLSTSLSENLPALGKSFMIRVVLLVAVVYLMTVKPG